MTAFTSSIQAIDVIVRDQHAKAIAERAVVEFNGQRWWAYEAGADPEYGPFGYGRTREEAIADLIEASDIDTSPDPTPEQMAAWRAAEDDWIPPGGWDDDDDDQPDDFDRDC